MVDAEGVGRMVDAEGVGRIDVETEEMAAKVLEFVKALKPTDLQMRRIRDRLMIWHTSFTPARTAKPQYDKVNFSR